MRDYCWAWKLALLLVAGWTAPAFAETTALPGLDLRFSGSADLPTEVPDFQKHVSPLLGRLGCNGRACHGSFQGRGGFRLSLFGYDFKADHEALIEQDSGRIDLNDISESLVLAKPADSEIHEGGKRFDVGSWQERVLRKWITSGAKFDGKIAKLTRLVVSPAEIRFNAQGEAIDLKAMAVWADGTSENVTSLCRFTTNDSSIAEIDENGHVVSGEFKGDTHVVINYDNAVVPIPVVRPVSDLLGDRYPAVATKTEIDRLVVEKLRKVGITPSGICDDSTFLRRVSLDLAGTLPSEKQVAGFLANQDPNKRAEFVEYLMTTEGYAAWWTTKLCDWTGNNDSQLRNTIPTQNASDMWYEWIYKRVAENQPYDQIVAGIVEARSRNEGESFQQYCDTMTDACRDTTKFGDREGMPFFWARTNFRTKEDRAIGFAYSFMGIRIQCAQCHKHPFDQWSQNDFEKFSNLFTQVQFNGNNGPDTKSMSEAERETYKQMLVNLNASSLKGNELRKKLSEAVRTGETVPFAELSVRTVSAKVNVKPNNKDKQDRGPTALIGELLGGGKVTLADDTRDDLMKWLRSVDNPYFAKAMVNRVWANYFGVGIVNPSDDLNLANPPSNATLFDWLARGFIENGFDMKWLHRTIVMSDTYQRSWETNETNSLDHRNFSHFVPRRLAAEVIYDAMVSATANDDQNEQFTVSRDGRAVEFADYDPQRRNNGFAYALSVFGRSTRESNCDCDRSEEPSLLQTVFLRNDQDVLRCLSDKDGWINEVCSTLNVPSLSNESIDLQKEQTRRTASLVNTRMAMNKQLQRLKADPKQQSKVERIVARIKDLDAQIATIAPEGLATSSSVPGQGKLSEIDAAKIVRSAYLRSLTREPTPEELSRSTRFMTSSENIAEGIEGVLWALINTKEFSLNH